MTCWMVFVVVEEILVLFYFSCWSGESVAVEGVREEEMLVGW